MGIGDGSGLALYGLGARAGPYIPSPHASGTVDPIWPKGKA